MMSTLCFGSIRTRAMRTSKKKVCNFVGGESSPLVANIVLHGLETVLGKQFPRSGSRGFQAPKIVVYADDFVILHEDPQIGMQCQEVAAEWLQEMGLRLKPSKTRITPTLIETAGTPGCDCLGFHIRQY